MLDTPNKTIDRESNSSLRYIDPFIREDENNLQRAVQLLGDRE
jgi:hypothetical protein